MSQGLRMVHLRTVSDAWQAKVIAARLGSEGILTHLQGSVAGPYPFGTVSVLVEEDQADLAAALLLADEVESAFAGHRLAMAGPGGGSEASGDVEASSDDIFALSNDDPEDARAASRACASWIRRAVAAVAALVVAGAPVLAHFIGQ
jgi:Putative prokaryotic signal transducing protein